MKIPIDDNITIAPFEEKDVHNLINYLNHEVIQDNTLRLPYPYDERNAKEWIAFALEERFPGTDYLVHWSIRNSEGDIIGGIGVEHNPAPWFAHRGEIGYWLAPELWDQGIMTKVVSKFSNFAFDAYNLTKLTAPVFVENKASAKVLENCGFKLEGTLKKHYFKNGRYRDTLFYSMLHA